MKKYVFLLLIFIACILKVNATPVELYDSAWKILSDNFYDKTMNNQDWNRWKKKYRNLPTYEDAYVAIDTMIESLNDSYTIFMQPQDYSDELLDMEGKEVKLGMILKKYRGKYYIIPVKDGAAEKAGLKKNDILLEIDGKSVLDMSEDEFESALCMEKKESVSFLVKRKFNGPKIYKITLEEKQVISILETPPYKKTKLPQNIKYLRIISFMDKTLAKQFQEFMENYEDKFDGYIIDVRGNSGGIAKNAAVMANMLLRDKVILSMVDRDGNKSTINSNDDTMTDKPVVILCDRYSASASEIFVAAIKDNKRGIIIGEKTYGKGVMQDVFELPNDCGMNITVKYYLTPSGKFIHKKGIEPDIVIKMSQSDYLKKNDKILQQAIKYIKSSINN